MVVLPTPPMPHIPNSKISFDFWKFNRWIISCTRDSTPTGFSTMNKSVLSSKRVTFLTISLIASISFLQNMDQEKM
ncbi:disease resistance protein RPV1 [Trifolium repens]|nr:disease resistance protein RPV1 [Trifolium repens]